MGRKKGSTNKIRTYEIKICPICGDQFIPAGQHIYNVGKKHRLVCSWHCVREYEKEHPQKIRTAMFVNERKPYKPREKEGKTNGMLGVS